MTPCDTKSIVDWLIDGARSAPRPEAVLAELCDQLVHAGIPLWRVAVFVRTLHPEIMGRRFIWQPDVGVTINEGLFDLLETERFQNSPFVAVMKSGRTIRRQLADQDNPEEFSIFRELRAEGATDYLATPLIFTNDFVHVATWSTRQVGGFTDAQIAGIETIVRPLARVAEIRALQRTASNLLDTYVGHDAGERILAGRIRRGHTETIHSVIWLSDMRGFTSMADRLPPQKLVVFLLNRYFDCQVPAISGTVVRSSNLLATGCLRSSPSLRAWRIHARPAPRARGRARSILMPSTRLPIRMECALVWRFISAKCSMAILAAAIGWISRASAPP